VEWNNAIFFKKKAGPHGSVGQAWIIDQMMSARCIPLVIIINSLLVTEQKKAIKKRLAGAQGCINCCDLSPQNAPIHLPAKICAFRIEKSQVDSQVEIYIHNISTRRCRQRLVMQENRPKGCEKMRFPCLFKFIVSSNFAHVVQWFFL
jgi:hypothetical protein